MVFFRADTGTTPAAAAVDGDSLKLDSLPIVDIRLLSQLELYSLSLCCSSSFDPHRCDDVVIPKIDRSVFNESAGSRKQTYSRLRLAPPSSSPILIRRRTPHLRTPAPNFVKINDNTDPENAENSYIITLLKELFHSDLNPDELVSVNIDYSHSRDELFPVKIEYSHSQLPAKSPSLPLSYASIVGNTSYKRKRGRPRKNELFEDGLELAPVEVIGIKHNVEGLHIENEIDVRENLDDREKEFVNRDGVAVDFVDLERVEHPFWEEIMHRTQGLKSEEELLGFLKGLDGQWGSRRKKRRIVDAREFGSALPIGWKLLLSIKKRNGRLWLYCRRYISPSGRQFLSCKDVSSYLLALHGAQSSNPAQQTVIVSDADKLTSVAIADHSVQDDQRKENLVSFTSPPAFTLESGNQEMQISINTGDSAEAHVPCSMRRSTVDEMLCFGSSKKDSSVADDDVLNRHKKMQYGISSVTRYNSDVSNHEPSNPGVRNTSKSVLFALSGHGNNFTAQNNYEICGRKNKVLGNSQNFGISELSDPFTSGSTALNLKSVTGIEQCRNLEDCSDFSSATETHLFSEDSVMRGLSGALEEHKQEPFEGILLGPSSGSEVFDKTYKGGGIYSAPPSLSKFSDVENTRKHELSLSFGKFGTKQLTDSNEDEQEQYQGKSFGIESSVRETYRLQTHITTQNSNASSSQKQGKFFGMDFLGSSFNARNREHDSFNMGPLGRDWDGPSGTSGQNIFVDFGNDCTQTPSSVKTGCLLRTGNSNVLRSGFGAASNLHDPSSKCSLTFDLISDKSEEGLFGVNETFDILVNDSRPGKTAPVEYRLMDELSSNSFPEESKIFPYVDAEQGLDPSFLLGNENLMTDTDGGHLVTSICVWCRNVFYHEPSQIRMQQTGAIGSMCPSCSNRIPGQFNVL